MRVTTTCAVVALAASMLAGCGTKHEVGGFDYRLIDDGNGAYRILSDNFFDMGQTSFRRTATLNEQLPHIAENTCKGPAKIIASSTGGNSAGPYSAAFECVK